MRRKVIIFFGVVLAATIFDWIAVHNGWYSAGWSHIVFWTVFAGIMLWIFKNIWAIVFWLPLGALLEDALYMTAWGITTNSYEWMTVKYGKLGEFFSYDLGGWPLVYPLGAVFLVIVYTIFLRKRLQEEVIDMDGKEVAIRVDERQHIYESLFNGPDIKRVFKKKGFVDFRIPYEKFNQFLQETFRGEE